MGELVLVLECPKCGAPFTANDATLQTECDHCGSLLVLTAPERDEIYLAESQVEDPSHILEIVVHYRVQAHRAEIIARYSDSEGNPPPEVFVAQRLAAYEKRLRASLRVTSTHRIHAPYWHLTGMIVQAILGRVSDGPKIVRLRGFGVDHAIPAYDAAGANLRDRGLRLGAVRARPLTAATVQERGGFLAWRQPTKVDLRELERWRRDNLDGEISATTKLGSLVGATRIVVYRSYWLARVVERDRQDWMLIDAGFNTIGGYPSEPEVHGLRRLASVDPLGSEGESYRRVLVSAPRCPDCGHEDAGQSSDVVHICTNCHVGIETAEGGRRLLPHSHVSDRGESLLDAEYLPFWRFCFQLQPAGSPAVDTLDGFVNALFPQRRPPGPLPCGPHVWVPAFRLLGTRIGDRGFQELVQWVHTAALHVEDQKVPLGGQPRFHGIDVPEREARDLVRPTLLAMHVKASSARLTTLLVRRAVENAVLTVTNPRLVLVPCATQDLRLIPLGGGPQVPRLLVERPPELLAQTATVHGARTKRR